MVAAGPANPTQPKPLITKEQVHVYSAAEVALDKPAGCLQHHCWGSACKFEARPFLSILQVQELSEPRRYACCQLRPD